MKKQGQGKRLAAITTSPRRAPLLRSAYWAWLLGAIGGAIWGVWQTYAMQGGWFWMTMGALLGVPLGIIAGCDLLIPGPSPDRGFQENRGNRVGPFRWAVLIGLVAVEGVLIGAYLWGAITLTCEHRTVTAEQPAQVDCRRTTVGWFNRRQTGEIVYDNVIGVGLDVHDELLLRHGSYAQARSAPGFGAAAVAAVEAFLPATTPILTLHADGWFVSLGPPICLLLALLAGTWAWFSVQQGLQILREQFALGEIYCGWRRP